MVIDILDEVAESAEEESQLDLTFTNPFPVTPRSMNNTMQSKLAKIMQRTRSIQEQSKLNRISSQII